MHKNIIIPPLLCQCGLFIQTCVSKNSIVSIMWFSTSFSTDNVISWSSRICKRSSFLSFYSLLVKFSEYRQGSDRVKLTKCGKVEWSEKCDYTSDILELPMFNLLFYCYIILYCFILLFSHKLEVQKFLSGKF